MALLVDRFCRLRPLLLHLTSRSNAEGILHDGEMYSAAELLRQSGHAHLIREHRRSSLQIAFRRRRTLIRDQAPVRPERLRLTNGWSAQDWIAHLRGHVFFWPCSPSRLGQYLRSFASKAVENNEVVLAFNTRVLIDLNLPNVRVSACNAGSMARAPFTKRGPGTLAPIGSFQGAPASVVEVAIHDRATLGRSLEWSRDVGGAVG